MIGNRWGTRVMQQLLALDNLISKRDKGTSGLNQTIKKKLKQVHYLKKEMRNQIANFLAKRYDLVMCPKLETGRLCMKKSRTLKTKVVRNMMAGGHCAFFDHLKNKCWEHGSKFLSVKEHYTSQTCPCCGSLNKCNETFTCKNCAFVHDRDIVGALNIFLRAVV
jgi:putative transposase